MALFPKKKNEPSKPATPLGTRVDAYKRLLDCFKIGNRLRFHPEFEDDTVLEALIIGYYVEGQFIYQQKHIDINVIEGIPSLTIKTPQGTQSYSRVSEFYLVVPRDVGLEEKLDYDSRATLGNTGPFKKGAALKLMSFQPGRDNLSCEAMVHRNIKMESGPHTGLTVVQLKPSLGTVQEYEPRSETRVNTHLPAHFHLNGGNDFLRCYILDYSESAMRVGLIDEDNSWPEMGKKDMGIFCLKLSKDSPITKLQCDCVDQRGKERIFKVTKINRQGQFVPFTRLDSLEFKVNLMNLFGE
ncbi:MAG: hypothetical protein AseanaTS_28510 [Candidatus Pelagadaptatus aseana]|uniref:hypothetical protein n=1 Tax=Candidatus Pelagadaptatus aseana TaxID=3120508 RepID=UPI0039B23451